MTTAVASDAAGYDRVSRAAHWAVAALALIVVSLGWAIQGVPRNTSGRDLLLLLHRSLGLMIFLGMLFFAAWRWRHPPPPLPPGLLRFERALARFTHVLLYLIFIIMPLSGYLNAAAAGHAVDLFGLVSLSPPLPENDRLSQIAIAVHLVGQYGVYFLVLLHLAGALFHGLIRRDGVIERMLPFSRPAGQRV